MHQLWNSFQGEQREAIRALEEAGFINDPAAINVEVLINDLNAEIRVAERTRRESGQIRDIRDKLYRYVVRASLLKRELWTSPELVQNEPSLRVHRGLLYKLMSLREVRQSPPHIFTTNYDLAVEWACESLGLKYYNGFDGVHFRSFVPQNFDLQLYNTVTRGAARFGVYGVRVVKLHGSLTWRLYGEQGAMEMGCLASAKELFEFADNPESAMIDRLMIFPGVAKYSDTTQYVYGELFRRFADFTADRQSTLFIAGYSFGDEHVNRILDTAINTPNIQFVIYSPDVQITNESFEIKNDFLRRFIERAAFRTLLVGNGARAYLDRLVDDLPGSYEHKDAERNANGIAAV